MGDSDRLEQADTVAAQSDRPSLAETKPDGAQRISSPALHLTRGGAIGRYIVVDQLASGGMGTVYAAYDPELDRKVAIKVLRWSEEGSQQLEARARMMREAQATARLSHPNVVAVYDVGPVGEQVFIAMELVDGATLAKWVNAEPHTLAEILEMFGQAGRGLAAAHRAGLVHRDFKPENVLVGKDGRARVADFGLVREANAPTDDATATPRGSMLSVALTQVGTIMGTPRYMAPEQRARKPADARADQYSFCVSLYEALHGRVPHIDTDPTAVGADAEPPVESRSVPAHVRAAIERGLAEEPDARWPNMDDLLAELARDPSARRRRWVFAGGGVLAAGAAVAFALALHRGAAPDACGGAEARLAGVWGAGQKATTERAFTATRVPFAPAVYASVAEELDGYAAAWRRSYEDSCRATNERHEQSMELLDLRSACLAKRRAELGALAALLANADAALVRNAASAAASLPPIADCDDVAALQAPARLPADAVKRRAIDDAHAELAQLDALLYAGRYNDALVRAKALAARAHDLEYRPLDAEAALLFGKILLRAGDPATADRILQDALAAAIAGHDDEIATRIAVLLVSSSADTSQFARGEQWATFASALIERVGNPPAHRAALYTTHGRLLSAAGKQEEAAAEHERARALRERVFPDTLELGKTYQSLSYVYDELGRYADARALGERSLAIEEKKLGPDHPDIAFVLNSLGNIAADEGKPDLARDYYVRALAIRERTVAEAGDDPTGIADLANNLGNLAAGAEHADEALAYYRRAVEVREKVDANDAEMALPLTGIAAVLQTQHKCADAIASYQKALALVESKLSEDHPYAGDALVGIGDCERQLGHLEDSQAALERALAIRKTDSRPIELGEVEWELARTLWARGSHPRALELAKAAREAIATSSTDAAKRTVAEIDDWLKGKS